MRKGLLIVIAMATFGIVVGLAGRGIAAFELDGEDWAGWNGLGA